MTNHFARTYLDDSGNRITVRYRGPLTSATVETFDGFKSTRHALQSPEDTYVRAFGESLAVTRALKTVLGKRERKMVRWVG